MFLRSMQNTNLVLFFGMLTIFGLAFLRVHMRVQTTLIGYSLGALKNTETTLLEKRSQLQMELAKLTTKEHLNMMISTETHHAVNSEPLAKR